MPAECVKLFMLLNHYCRSRWSNKYVWKRQKCKWQQFCLRDKSKGFSESSPGKQIWNRQTKRRVPRLA